MARPQERDSWRTTSTEGTDIVLAIDVSSSMMARDFDPDRFQAAKEVAAKFIAGRESDNIGIVIFAGESLTGVPMTVDQSQLLQYLQNLNMNMLEDGTAIGDGIATALNRLKEGKAKSKSIILLTDGSNNTGVVAPVTASEVAKELGVKIYTIGIGTNGTAPYPVRTLSGRIEFQPQPVVIDENTLRTIADSTGGDYTEGNAWQYTWHVQHDVPGLISLFGGEESFLNKLDSLFTLKLETTQADVTGLIGQYAHGNEPSHHITYLYALAGRPERTQELIREIFDTQYRPEPDGLCGNDDCGQMSAWYMFSAMGFYPVDPVSGNYVFGAPQMPKIVLHLADGKTFTVIAEGISKENKYIDSITLNGEPYTKNYISHEDILKGGTLVYKMK